jgi:hypothetical protein
MRRVTPMLGLVLLTSISVSCVPRRETPAGPGALPRISGDYTLTVTPSSVCQLPMRSQSWPVVVTSSGLAVGDTIKVTLPGGNPGVQLSLVYQTSATNDLVTGPLQIAGTDSAGLGVVISGDLRFFASGMANGRVSAEPNRPGEISGGFDGPISLSHPDDFDRASRGSCAAADHQWTIRAR